MMSPGANKTDEDSESTVSEQSLAQSSTSLELTMGNNAVYLAETEDQHFDESNSNATGKLPAKKDNAYLRYGSRFLDSSTNKLKYTIMECIGSGSFSRVYRAYDKKRNRLVAIKVNREVSTSCKAGEHEVRLMRKLKELDPNGKRFTMQIMETFMYGGNVCIVMQLMGQSIHQFMKLHRPNGLPMHQIKEIALQIFVAVKFLHDNKLTHADLKPENILFVNSAFEEIVAFNKHGQQKPLKYLKNTEIRLIDFNHTVFDSDYHQPIIVTYHYRPPEVLLGLDWSQSLDVWSLGCILFELYHGVDVLFSSTEDKEQLAMMQKVLGTPVPKPMILKSNSTMFDRCFQLNWTFADSIKSKLMRTVFPLQTYKRDDDADTENLFNLIELMLKFEPSDRITVGEAMKHSFFRNEIIKRHRRENRD